jgi:hypothetical protein
MFGESNKMASNGLAGAREDQRGAAENCAQEDL